jgi:alpha-tubulin suppressor-like RCC1 family protein
MGFKDGDSDPLHGYPDKGYLIDIYPQLADVFKSPLLWVWGENFYGAVGDNSTVNKSTPVQTIAAGNNWKYVASGHSYSVALKTNNTLWTWGLNGNGQLGDDTTTSKSTPIQVGTDTNWISISNKRHTTVSIKADGTLWSWGDGSVGQLGNNSITHTSSPVQTAPGGTDWHLASAGQYHTIAIKSNGTLWSWGNNTVYGQLGDNSTVNKSTPVQIGTGTNWQSISCGSNHNVALKSDGTLWSWGLNNVGQMGDSTSTSKSTPVQVGTDINWRCISSGGLHTTSIKTDGTLWVWGKNTSGQLGDDTIISKSSPIQTVSGGTNWKSVSAGSLSTVAAIKSDGTLWAWGRNNYGQLGDDSVVDKSTPVQIGIGTNWKSVSAGQLNTLAIKDADDDF